MKVALGQEEETVAQGLPGSLMYVLYEELCTQAWCSQDPVASLGTMDQTNMGTEKMRNLSTMYSEAEPRSRASGTGEGNLPVIPHHGPSACSQPWGPTPPQHVLRGPRAPWGGGEERRLCGAHRRPAQRLPPLLARASEGNSNPRTANT